VIGYRLDDRDSIHSAVAGIFPKFRPALGAVQPPVQLLAVRGESDQNMKLTTHHLLISRLRIRGAIPPLPPIFLMLWCLMKHRDDFVLRRMFGPKREELAGGWLVRNLTKYYECEQIEEDQMDGPFNIHGKFDRRLHNFGWQT